MFLSSKWLLVSLAVMLTLSFHPSTLTIGQEVSTQTPSLELPHPTAGAIDRGEFFSLDSLDESTKRFSEELLLKALDGEAFTRWWGSSSRYRRGFGADTFLLTHWI